MRKTVKKAFLLNEAISNTAMGTSADEQMLCCRVFLSLISHSAVSCLQGGGNLQMWSLQSAIQMQSSLVL